MRPVEVTALVLFAGSLLLIFVLVVRRSFLAAQPAPELHGEEAQAFAEILGGYARRVSGDARERIAAYFEASGGVDEELRYLRSGHAWRRATAAFTLGDMGSPRAVPDLLGALDDRARDVRMPPRAALAASARSRPPSR